MPAIMWKKNRKKERQESIKEEESNYLRRGKIVR